MSERTPNTSTQVFVCELAARIAPGVMHEYSNQSEIDIAARAVRIALAIVAEVRALQKETP